MRRPPRPPGWRQTPPDDSASSERNRSVSRQEDVEDLSGSMPRTRPSTERRPREGHQDWVQASRGLQMRAGYLPGTLLPGLRVLQLDTPPAPPEAPQEPLDARGSESTARRVTTGREFVLLLVSSCVFLGSTALAWSVAAPVLGQEIHLRGAPSREAEVGVASTTDVLELDVSKPAVTLTPKAPALADAATSTGVRPPDPPPRPVSHRRDHAPKTAGLQGAQGITKPVKLPPKPVKPKGPSTVGVKLSFPADLGIYKVSISCDGGFKRKVTIDEGKTSAQFGGIAEGVQCTGKATPISGNELSFRTTSGRSVSCRASGCN